MAKFWEALEVENMAQELIKAYECVNLLDKCNILYYFTDTIKLVKGKIAAAYVKKFSGLQKQQVQNADFGIIFTKELWEKMAPQWRKAVLFHELNHIVPDIKFKDGQPIHSEDDNGNKKWKLKGHDIEEFSIVIKMFGPYHDELQDFLEDIKNAPNVVPLHVVVDNEKDSKELDQQFEQAICKENKQAIG